MSVSLWTGKILGQVKDHLESNLPAALTAIASDGGATVAPPAAYAVQDDIDSASQLPFLAVRTAGVTSTTDMMPASYRLQIPLEVVCVCSPEANPKTPDLAARTTARGILNVLTSDAFQLAVDGVYWVGEPGTEIERLDDDAHRWRRMAVCEVTLYVATTRTV